MRSWLAVLALLYAATVLGWQVARQTALASWWLFALADLFGVWLYLPLSALGLVAGLRRDWRAAGWLVVPLLLFGLEYGPQFVPHVGVGHQGMPLRVLTVNLLWTNGDVPAVGETLLAEGPDVIAVQELSQAMAGGLSDALRDTHPFQALYPDDAKPFGAGVFSRYPLRELRPPDLRPGTCYCQEVSVELPGQSIELLNVHTQPVPALTLGGVDLPILGRVPIPVDFTTAVQEPSQQALLRRVEALAGPRLMVGDLNSSDREPFYRVLGRRLVDAYREAGWGFGYTFPVGSRRGIPLFPLLRIDYVWHDAAWTTQAARTVYIPGSDHRAVSADLLLHEVFSPARTFTYR